MSECVVRMEMPKRSKQDILDYFSDINHAYNDSTMLSTLNRMLDELIEDAAQRWHRVEEPPEGHMWCFVYTHEPEMIMPIRIAYYVASCTGKGSWYHYESGDDIDDEVDYWTPMYLEVPDLPWPIEPPKEDA